MKKKMKIMTEKEATLPSFGKTLRKATEKENRLQPNIPTCKILELNVLIYAGTKLVRDKIGVPLMSPNRNTKPGSEIWPEGKKFRQQAKVMRKKTTPEDMLRWKDQNKKSLTIELKEINQKILAKDGGLKWYRDRVKRYKQNRTLQSNERQFYEQLGEICTKTYCWKTYLFSDVWYKNTPSL